MKNFPQDSRISGYNPDGTPMYDRRYTSQDLRDFYAAQYTNGYIHETDNSGKVEAATGGVTVNPCAWVINGAIGQIDAPEFLPITAEGMYSVMVRLDVSEPAREIAFRVAKGDAGYPDPVRSGEVYELCIAHVNVTDSISLTDMRDDAGCCGIAQHKIEVAHLAEIEADLAEAKAAAESANAAKSAAAVSETNAESSAKTASDSAAKAATSEQNANASQQAAASSATEAAQSATKASASEAAAKTSESNAKNSENNAKASATTATDKAAEATQRAADAEAAEGRAQDAADDAATSEANAKAHADVAKASEQNAKESEQAAKTSETNADSSAKAAKTSETNADASRIQAEQARDAAHVSESNADAFADHAEDSANKAANSAALAKKYADEAEALLYKVPFYDEGAGEFTNRSIQEWLAWNNDGLLYGVKQPKDERQACTKTRANAGIANPVPGTLANAGSDPYFGRGPFRYYDCNATVDDNGQFHVTGIADFGGFVDDGTKDVFVLTPIRYISSTDTGDGYIELINSDTSLPGLEREPRSVLQTGEKLPFMLRAKYPMSIDSDGKPWSVSGAKIANRTVSQQSLKATCAKKGESYSGLTYADDAYLYDMFLLKYANKSSQTVFKGCTQAYDQVHPTVAESGVKRVVVARSVAARYPVGSCWMLGRQETASTDRGNIQCYNVFDGLKVVSKETVDSNNTALVFDSPSIFDVETTYLLSTAPWQTGACDGIKYDGSPTSNVSGLEPFTLQGIECMHGALEIVHDGLASNDGSGWILTEANSTANAASSVTANYTTILNFPLRQTAGWYWPTYSKKNGGAWLPQGESGSGTTGVGDAIWLSEQTSTGTREVLSRGDLGGGSYAGLRYLLLLDWVGIAWWNLCSRLSVNGQNGVNFAA